MSSFSANPMTAAPVPGTPERRKIAILAYPGVTLLDIAGPAQVFASVKNPPDVVSPYETVVVSRTGGMIPTDAGMSLETRRFKTLDDTALDTLIVPGGPGVWQAQADPRLVKWIAATAATTRRVASVCLGTFLLAETGLLDGRRAVTHWRQCDRLRERFPRIRTDPDAIFVRDGSVWSSAGVSAGIDLALAMVEEDFGHSTALDVARRLVVFLKRPGGQSQFSSALATQSSDVDGRFDDLHGWIMANLADDLRVEALAAWAGMTPRSFARAYKARTGSTPARAVEALRIEAACRLLADKITLTVAEIAFRCGFGDDERMRRAFIRRLGISPAEYRRRFAREA